MEDLGYEAKIRLALAEGSHTKIALQTLYGIILENKRRIEILEEKISKIEKGD